VNKFTVLALSALLVTPVASAASTFSIAHTRSVAPGAALPATFHIVRTTAAPQTDTSELTDAQMNTVQGKGWITFMGAAALTSAGLRGMTDGGQSRNWWQFGEGAVGFVAGLAGLGASVFLPSP
jgi:hypothetical protein